ncbi:MAG: helix-turn-helix domain-containing protein [Bryobacterales bacterium]|nr:helix-turn-helix domain-containing protein [Bryobacterales bacterium]
MIERLFLKPAEAATAIGVGRTSFYKLVKAGVIPSCRVGKSIRISVSALRAWAEAQAGSEPDKAIRGQ